MAWDIHQTGIIEWLEEYEGPRFHGIVSDPPYALISIAKRFGPGQAPAQEGEDGRYSRLSKGFMGSEWDSFSDYGHYQSWIAEWSKLLIEKALYPGAVCLFFGGTRTFHHLGVGLERGGFEIVDSILVPWLHGQGFPKSHDISKGLDKAAGAEREVVGTKKRRDIRNLKSKKARASGVSAPLRGDPEYVDLDVTLPATPDAEEWDGYGTSLKPAWEPVFVCRAPRGDHTFAELAKIYGTGALNIDGARIGHNEPEEIMQPRSSVYGKTVYANAKLSEERDGSDELASPNPVGRWPANLMLTHHEACVKVGEYETKGRVINRWKDGMLPFGGGAGQEYETVDPSRAGEPSADRTYEHEGGTDFAMKPGARRGMETVDLYACVPSCPVRALDDQAGFSTSIRSKRGNLVDHRSGRFGAAFGAEIEGSDYERGHADSGGPSRFFYTAKASRSEKDKGLENFYWKRTGEDGWIRISEEEWAKLDKSVRARGNIHPTCKPLELLRYLATLILPPKQEDHIRRILVPFSGSGSEIIAAIQAGWDVVEGVEREEIYVEMAEARLRGSIGML